MAKITIDGKEYEEEALSDSVKQQLVMLRLVDQELSRLQTQTAIAQTARLAYARELQKGLAQAATEQSEGLDFSSDTISFT
jgi:Family of unknown function (DUF6447)